MPTTSAETGDTSHRGSRRRQFQYAVLLLLLSATVRVRAGCDNFWLDEIWTLNLLSLISSPWQILTSLHQENNHYLNSLFIWLIGPQPNWVLYRVPSMLAGVAAVALAGSIARRRGDAAGLFAMTFMGGSYLMIHYSSEARGYSLAVCSALACLDCQERVFRGGGWGAVAGTAASAIAGILSQPVFLAFYGALLPWSMARMVETGRGRWRLRKEWWLSHVPPLAFFAWLYAVDLGQVINAGGPIYSPVSVVLQTLSLAIGGPDGVGQAAGAFIAMAALAASLVLLWRADSDWCALAVLSIFVLPAVLLIVAGREEIYPRYFVIPVAIVNVTFGIALGRLWQKRTRFANGACLLLASAWFAGNSVHVSRLLELGRGNFSAAVAYLEQQTRDRQITVASDQDLRNLMVLDFYGRYLPEPERLAYFKKNELPPAGPEWRFVHSLDRRFVPRPSISDSRGQQFRLERFYPYAGLSGWCWAVYHIDKGPIVE